MGKKEKNWIAICRELWYIVIVTHCPEIKLSVGGICMTTDEKLDILIESMAGLKEDVSGLKEDVSGLKKDVSGLKEEVSGLKEDVSGLKEDVSGLKEDVSVLKAEVSDLKVVVSSLKQKIISIEITLENETNRNIEIIAENHINLDRKLEEALKAYRDNEIFQIRVNVLDAEVKRIAAGLR